VTFQQVDEERSAVVHWTHLEKFYKVIAWNHKSVGYTKRLTMMSMRLC
jgi:hypothetical protein